ncbi:MAG: hypothetical protein ACJAYY_000703 [Paraglaciecola sp.]|jgi:hypothetical protein
MSQHDNCWQASHKNLENIELMKIVYIVSERLNKPASHFGTPLSNKR